MLCVLHITDSGGAGAQHKNRIDGRLAFPG
jgi:hypothetical protein